MSFSFSFFSSLHVSSTTPPIYIPLNFFLPPPSPPLSSSFSCITFLFHVTFHVLHHLSGYVCSPLLSFSSFRIKKSLMARGMIRSLDRFSLMIQSILLCSRTQVSFYTSSPFLYPCCLNYLPPSLHFNILGENQFLKKRNKDKQSQIMFNFCQSLRQEQGKSPPFSIYCYTFYCFLTS